MNPIDWSKPAAEILEDLLADVVGSDPTPVTMAMVKDRLTTDQYNAFRLSFIAAKAGAGSQNEAAKVFAEDIADTQTALATGGFVLNTDARQALLDEMAPALGWSEGLLVAMKRIGRPVTKRWASEGFGTEPTLEQVTARKSREIAIASTADRINAASEARRAAVDNAASTGAEIIAATEAAFG